jgi:hypothetical protein
MSLAMKTPASFHALLKSHQQYNFQAAHAQINKR